MIPGGAGATAAAQIPRRSRAGAQDPERDRKVVAAYAEGGLEATFRSVADEVGLAPERVRQLVVRWEAETGQSIPRTPERRRAAKLAEEARRLGDEEARRRIPSPSIAQRLLAQVRANAETECWEWTGSLMYPGGRPYPKFDALDEQFAHRVSFRLWIGPIPPEHLVLQACDGRFCINPFHLFTIAKGDAVRLWNTGAKRPPATHCKRGHALTDDNVIWNTSAAYRCGIRTTVRTRLCRICAQDRQRRNYKKPPALPPLPTDEHERELELAIRRVERAPLAKRTAVLAREAAWCGPGPIEVPALGNEPWEDYAARTGRDGHFLDWLPSRLLDHPRIARALVGGRGQKVAPAPGGAR